MFLASPVREQPFQHCVPSFGLEKIGVPLAYHPLNNVYLILVFCFGHISSYFRTHGTCSYHHYDLSLMCTIVWKHCGFATTLEYGKRRKACCLMEWIMPPIEVPDTLSMHSHIPYRRYTHTPYRYSHTLSVTIHPIYSNHHTPLTTYPLTTPLSPLILSPQPSPPPLLAPSPPPPPNH